VNNTINSSLVWLRRDLRLYDHKALFHALKNSNAVYCCFIFDIKILDKLSIKNDRRIDFIWHALKEIKADLNKLGSDLIVEIGDPVILIPSLIEKYKCNALFLNKDYEKYAIDRDNRISDELQKKNIETYKYKDQVIFEEREILTQNNSPYTVFTPYKNTHLKKIFNEGITQFDCESYKVNLAKFKNKSLQSLKEIGFEKSNISSIKIPLGTQGGLALIEDFKTRINNYNYSRNFPGIKGVSYLSVHNRFGTVSIRHLAKIALEHNSEGSSIWLNELIWRDFYFQILSNFPHIQDGETFKSKYNNLKFENDEKKFSAWANGKTGFPIVDAGMRQLNSTGFMHNRLRMIIACFLVKDLLIDWRWGEKYFAEHLIDFDFSANNGGWQWAASTGCDAQPYFRIFNPLLQSEKFDPEGKFIKRYVPELELLNKKQIHQPSVFFNESPNNFPVKMGLDYPFPIVSHAEQKLKIMALFKNTV
jgi:deoxyribodipyrimidine photo-lyase